MQHSQRPAMQQMHMQPLQQVMQPQIPQNMHNSITQQQQQQQQQTSNIQHAANQHRQITPQTMQPHLQQHNIQQGIQPHLQTHIQSQYQQQQANRVQPLIPLSPHVPNGHVQNNAFSPSSNHGQNQYLGEFFFLSNIYFYFLIGSLYKESIIIVKI